MPSPPSAKKPNIKAAMIAARLKQAEAECLELSGSLGVLLDAMDAAWPGVIKASQTVNMARGWARESLIKAKVANEVRQAGKFTDTGREVKAIPTNAIFDGEVFGTIGQWGEKTKLHLYAVGSDPKAPDMIFESLSVNIPLAHLIGEPLRIVFTTAHKERGK